MPGYPPQEVPLSRDEDAASEFSDGGWTEEVTMKEEAIENGEVFSHVRMFAVVKDAET
jgi:hypothetical protein